ncbi:transglycosylase SLT domain-containing protein [Rhodoferax sp.]|uniref:transglycosylase SLT domain-containing protein n=1 Tax=Rhodoferax sp. TaxID=50421 RepID=UPI001EC1483B|nr:transglycosylase SLT domain-containing protein [Rhodoferax sp.]MBT9508292.1 transglycosylase SLT domain-containing protein [Rhodoferax sp.]
MKFIIPLGLSALLWLTGCATTGMAPETGPSASASSESTASASRSATGKSYRPVIPGGPLQPITTSQATSRTVAQLAPPADLWERIRRGYGMPDLQSDLVHDREQWYSTRPDYILRMTERSSKYLFHIVEELERRNMPTELALLPFIESAFNPQAVSTAKAAGMWQFMPATGKHFELKQNAFRDDRRDVLASTRAALDYLQRLHGMFGDWHLALAAYNWGEGSVGRAIAKNQKAGLGTTYTDLNMPMETRLYVPKLQAVKNIVGNPDAFSSRLPLIENHPYFQTVDIKRDIDVALAAKLAEVPLEDFKALNPSASRPVILAAGTPQILLPWDKAAIFQSNLEAYGGGRLASWTVWLAPTTMKPADAAKRVGMSEAELRSINNIPPRVVIKAGSSLLVTRSKHLETDVGAHAADNGQLSLAPDAILKRTVLKAGKQDSVASLAKRYRVSPASVAEWNKVSASASFRAGQQIVLFLPVPAKAVAKGKPAPRQARKGIARATRVAKR